MNKKQLVLDASVIIKWFTKEEGREKALKIRKMFANDEVEISVPDLMIYEVSNALNFNPHFSSEDVKNALDSLMKMDLNIITPQKSTLDRSIEIASSKNASVYDAFYIALAEDLGSELITSDERLYNNTEDLDVVKLLEQF